uniref:Uncharacterized protein n=1 Tax=Rhizophora mucronata TaxID=61149 RepID=A0A2P2JGX8_RHIMU
MSRYLRLLCSKGYFVCQFSNLKDRRCMELAVHLVKDTQCKFLFYDAI